MAVAVRSPRDRESLHPPCNSLISRLSADCFDCFRRNSPASPQGRIHRGFDRKSEGATSEQSHVSAIAVIGGPRGATRCAWSARSGRGFAVDDLVDDAVGPDALAVVVVRAAAEVDRPGDALTLVLDRGALLERGDMDIAVGR